MPRVAVYLVYHFGRRDAILDELLSRSSGALLTRCGLHALVLRVGGRRSARPHFESGIVRWFLRCGFSDNIVE